MNICVASLFCDLSRDDLNSTITLVKLENISLIKVTLTLIQVVEKAL
jgi:hypothetical protein